jgi:hypothetical protein
MAGIMRTAEPEADDVDCHLSNQKHGAPDIFQTRLEQDGRLVRLE